MFWMEWNSLHVPKTECKAHGVDMWTQHASGKITFWRLHAKTRCRPDYPLAKGLPQAHTVGCTTRCRVLHLLQHCANRA